MGEKQFDELIARALADCLKSATGLPVRKAAGGAEINLAGAWCYCQAILDNFFENESGAKCTASVKIVLSKEEVIEDFIVGAGDSFMDAASFALQQFVNGIVVPVAAVSNRLSPEHAGHGQATTISKIIHNRIDWNVSLSQVISNDVTGQLYEMVDRDPPMNILWTALEQKMNAPGPHWAKLFLCRYPDGELDGAVLIDNEPYEPGLQSLLRFEWPTDQELIWFRQFCFFEPVGFTRSIPSTRSMNPLQWLVNHFS